MWNDRSRASRESAALDLVAPVLGLAAGDRTQVLAALGRTEALDVVTGDAYAAFRRTFPAPHARLERARDRQEAVLVAELESWFDSRRRGHAERSAERALDLGSGAAAGDDAESAFVGTTVALVRAMALPLTRLPGFLGDHIGTSDPISGELAERTVGDLRWIVTERSLRLVGDCPHPALDVAVRECAEGVERLLVELARLAPARTGSATGSNSAPSSAPDAVAVPLRVEAELSASLRDGWPSYVEPGVRFLLAEDRIRSLLMGENLYRRSGLALRELYQNAVDACRHRAARLDFLARTQGADGGPTGSVAADAPVAPAVVFTQDRDAEGRAFIECADSGVGMGLAEIRGAFCQAGIRAADLPEYLEELEDFRRLDPPVRLWTNSRFGIGALSYFMLADEIVVTTTRTHRDGSLGHTLRVHIPSAGTYFRIEDLGPGTTPGTTVRLMLREGVEASCVEELQSVVVVASYELTAVDRINDRIHRWAANKLDAESTALDAEARAIHAAAPSSDGVTRIWFTAGPGAVLADGLWAGQAKPNVIVNLSAELAPRLSVDRTEMISWDEAATTRLLLDAAPALAGTDVGEVLFRLPRWLLRLASTEPDVADELYRARAALGPWPYPVLGSVVDASGTGLAALDHDLFSVAAKVEGGAPAGWRASAVIAAGAAAGLEFDARDWNVTPALPSDSVLLSRDLDGVGPWLSDLPSPARVACVAVAQRRPVDQVVARLRALGYRPDDIDPLDEIDRRLLDALQSPIKKAQTDRVDVADFDLVTLAGTLRLPPAEVVRRCARFGIVPDRALRDEPVTSTDLLIASRDLDSKAPWRSRHVPVEVHEVVAAATAARRDVADVCERFVRLGYRVPTFPPGYVVGPADEIILSRDGDGRGPWLTVSTPVSIGTVMVGARASGLPLDDVVDRLRLLGLTVAPDGPAARTDPDAAVLLTVDLDARAPWLAAGTPISRPFLLRAARACGRDPEEVRDFYRSLGFPVEDPRQEGAGDTSGDAILTSRDLDGRTPFLSPAVPVTAEHVCTAAIKTARTPAAVAARLTELGFRIQRPTADAPPTQGALRPGSAGFATAPHRALPPGYLEPAQLVLEARKKKSSLAGLPEQIAEAGFVLVGSLPDRVDRIDRKLVTRDLDGLRPVRSTATVIGRVTLLSAARRLKLPPAEVAARLHRLGYVVDAGPAPLPAKVGKTLHQLLGGTAKPSPGFDECLPAGVIVAVALRRRLPIARACAILRDAGVTFVDPRDVLPIRVPGAADVGRLVGAGWDGDDDDEHDGCCC